MFHGKSVYMENNSVIYVTSVMSQGQCNVLLSMRTVVEINFFVCIGLKISNKIYIPGTCSKC